MVPTMELSLTGTMLQLIVLKYLGTLIADESQV